MDVTVSTCFIAVDDHEKALEFYRDALGLEVRNDVKYEGMRWLTVGAPEQPGVSIVLEPPAADPNASPADRQAMGKITKDGVFLEELEHNPAKYLPDIDTSKLGGEVVKIDLNKPMKDILGQLSRHPIKTRLSLTGTMIVARDLAHGKLRARLEKGEGLPDYFKQHPIYYAGPAKTPEGYASGSFGPTTAGRMDSFIEDFQKAGGALVTVALVPLVYGG